MKVCVAHSEDPLTGEAANELIEQIRSEFGDSSPDAGLLFASIEHELEPLLASICDAFPAIELIGCTTDGEISSRLAYCEDSITLVAFSDSELSFAAGLGRDLSKGTEAACDRAVNSAREKLQGEGKFCITTAESLTVSAVELVIALRGALGDTFPIVGGVAGDNWSFTGTKQFYGREVLDDSVPILLLDGPVLFSVAHASGWEPLDAVSTVTRSKSNIVYEIGGESALDYYRRHKGESVTIRLTPETPLAVLEDDGFYLRAPIATDGDTGSITFVGDVPEGATVSLTKTLRTDIVEASRDAMVQAVESYPGDAPAFALFFTCAARKQLLGTKTKEEYLAVSENLPPGTPVCGLYTYGEIAPLRAGNPSRFHNQTCVAVLIGR